MSGWHLKGMAPLSKTGWISFLVVFLAFSWAEGLASTYYDIGSPTLTAIWVDPVYGNDTNSGLSRSQALLTLSEAMNHIPTNTTIAQTGYKVLMVPGDYPESYLPDNGWIGSRQGTYLFPIIIEAADGHHTVRLHGYLNINSVAYFYLINLDFVTDPGYGGGSNVIHISNSHHVLIRGCKLDGYDGGIQQPQETLKVNQVQYIYVENCDIAGAFWFPLDFVAVQYGHILYNQVHDSGDDCLVLKGGTAYLTIERNEIYNNED